MSGTDTNEPMLDMYIFETSQLIEQLEQSILTGEKESDFTEAAINEIFRIMHTIKGSSAMMMFHGISSLSHSMEDLFYFIREEKPKQVDYSALSDLVLEGVDFVKVEVEKIKNNDNVDGNVSDLISNIEGFMSALKKENDCYPSVKVVNQKEDKKQNYISQSRTVTSSKYNNAYKAVIYFEEGCEMENIRAYTIIHNLMDITNQVYYIPGDIIDNDESADIIKRDGFKIYLKSDFTYEKMHEFFVQTIFLRELELRSLENEEEFEQFLNEDETAVLENPVKVPSISKPHTHQSIISVSVNKLDMLMDLVGEMVISEAMVIQNPDLQGLELNNFSKAAQQLNKITGEIQDMVMSIRMVPLSATFHKMHRIVRDMCKKLHKEVHLEMIGEDTEVDKNIIEHISDPLMHLVRNALDHGVENTEERISRGKNTSGTIILEAKNAGSDVLIIVKDDGRGLDREKILTKARENGMIYKEEEEMSDKEVFNLILLPGFSTKDNITEFSGRGVGMDVVSQNIETLGGSTSVESTLNQGTTITLKIPLTLAIIDGMNIKVGNSCYTIPTVSIKESFRPKEKDILTDPDGNEMVMVRGHCYPVLRLHEYFGVSTDITEFIQGIIIMIELDEENLCIFADELIGQQQVVVKALPEYIKKSKKIKGLAGCTLLGDGSISLILDVGGLISI